MFKKVMAIALAVVLVCGLFAGCNKSKTYEPSEREQTEAIVFGIDGADGVFSPFFSTAAYDSEIAGMTQLGMLTSEGSNYVYGDDQACVVKDLKITYLDSNNTEIKDSNGAAYTRYDFLIKNGLKFSDGEPLTIDDVLFNLYVYLDPAYTGSSTIYSTDIVGMDEYRTQQKGENAGEALDKSANTNANNRLTRIYNWLINQYLIEFNGGESTNQYPFTSGLEKYEEEIKGDIDYFLAQYKKEIETNYESAVSSFEEDRKAYKFDAGEYWESYFYTYGLVSVKTSLNKPVKEVVKIDETTGAYQVQPEGTQADPENGIYEVYVIDFDDEYADTKADIEAYAEANWQDQEGANETEKRNNAKKEAAIDMVYRLNVGYTDEDTDQFVWEWLNFANTILGSGSTSTLFTEILADERTKLIEAAAGDEAVRSISGITTSKVTSFTNSEGKYNLDGEYDVLTIKINKVDPKAIWNFAFTVAPKHYYAPESELQKYEDQGKLVNFGVVYASTDFMNDVLKSSERLGVPVGAGPYMASQEGGLSSNQKYPAANQFMRSNRIYYERNPYFDLVDGVENGGAIQNARIKYLQYTVVNSNFLLDSLAEHEIDVGSPNATKNNVNRLNSLPELTSSMNKTNGYGYVGINAGKIADVWLRRAIIKAMDTKIISEGYYNGGLCELIYRPISTESWAYPKNEAAMRPFVGETMDMKNVDYIYDGTGEQIKNMLEVYGEYSFSTLGVFDKDGNKVNKITFTVAGESTDHPAWQMFKNAEEVLESIGFEIDVKTDAFALNKLSRGELAVWAAAWSSTIDPDMYQVYHKDSQAGSTLNWGYREIYADSSEKYAYERMVIDELSVLIDQARTMVEEPRRAEIYAKALDLVMELAVEMPTYQRNDMTVYNNTKIDGATLNKNPTSNDGLFSKIWEVGYIN